MKGGVAIPIYNKLVRDRIPEIIAESGKECRVSTVSGARLLQALQTKLSEELDEFLASDSELEELADILEVVEALAVQLGSSLSEVEELRQQKRIARGGFEKGIWLEWVED